MKFARRLLHRVKGHPDASVWHTRWFSACRDCGEMWETRPWL